MKHVWVNLKHETNNKVIFKYKLNQNANRMVLSASAFYTVYFDDNLVSYGPERTADGYSRIREIPITKKNIEIKVLIYDYGIPSLDKDFGNSFFGCEIYNHDNLVASTDDFKAYESTKYVSNSIKYSFQRGFIEHFDLRNIQESELATHEVKNIKILKGIGDKCHYNECPFGAHKDDHNINFDIVNLPNYTNVDNPFFKAIGDLRKAGYTTSKTYELKQEKSGLLKIKANSKQVGGKIIIAFDEYLADGKWAFGRSSCSDAIFIDTDLFEGEIITSTVYSLKHLRVITNSSLIDVTPSLILIQNDEVPEVKKTGDEKLDLIIEAARNTFMQNAVDIFTDCPGRERGAWLCDSYFTALAERFFTGKNEIERCFLENFIIGTYEELDKGMLPMVFPAQEKLFIPNWAMWFVLELEQYYLRTGDRSLVDLAKVKVYGLFEYFEKYENDWAMLENLPGWVFVEWSDAGTEDFVKGVSYPTNMLYAAMHESASRLYNDKKLSEKAWEIRLAINKNSFDCKLYHDNALRPDGEEISVVKEHTSETCQYYALFFNMRKDKDFANFVKNELGPLRSKESHKEIARSNSFIGNYLRFLWLNQIGEIERIKKEAIDYFYKMASYSGTLWEKDSPTASCNHGFASSIAPILLSKDLIK